jgi:hypothetical protein
MKTKCDPALWAAGAKDSDQVTNRLRPSRGRWLALGLGGLLFAFVRVNDGGAESPPTSNPDLGPNASLHGYRPFPDNSAWNTPVDTLPVDAKSPTFIKSIGADKPLHPDFGAPYEGAPLGIPYVVVAGAQPKVSLTFEYGDESDPGPYPIPADAPIEGGPQGDGDRHVLVIDRDNKKLYEVFAAFPEGKGWRAGAGAVFDLKSNKSRPAGWTSADAAGLPIFPGLVRYDEVMEQKEIRHALRFTVQKTQQAYVAPASHWASESKDPSLPPMGLRVRLKADYNISNFPEAAQVILRCLKTYGMILADNGSDWFISGAPDDRWDDDALGALKRVKGGAFEVVQMGQLTKE